MNPNLIRLSHSTYVGPSGATAAATHSFFSKDYKPPAQDRSIDYDVVHNQNGKFKWIFDNGPAFRKWPTFVITCQSKFQDILGANANQQFANLLKFWNYPGKLRMEAPDGLYDVHWAAEQQEQSFIRFPREVGDAIEMDVAVMFEEA